MRSGALNKLVFILLVAVFCTAASARDNPWVPGEESATWRTECGACHTAFPPALLPKGEWMEIMAQLGQHFGVDASLEAGTQQEITDYLRRNGANAALYSHSDVLPRVTSGELFEDKHRSAIRLWRKGRVKSLSDCATCHKTSETVATKD